VCLWVSIRARILEIAYQFLLFRIDRDDRLAVRQKTASLFVDVFKLSIPIHIARFLRGIFGWPVSYNAACAGMPNDRMADVVPLPFSSAHSFRS